MASRSNWELSLHKAFSNLTFLMILLPGMLKGNSFGLLYKIMGKGVVEKG